MNLEELELYFKNKELPKTLQYDQATVITDVAKFVDSHLTVIKLNGHVPAFSSFLYRLNRLKDQLEAES